MTDQPKATLKLEWDRIEQLLGIVDKAKDHPKLASVTQAALAELDQHAAEATKQAAVIAKQKADEDAAAAAKRVEEVRKAEADRLAKEEAAIKARPAGKTPAELQAEAEAARAAGVAAAAGARVEQPDPTIRRPLGENPNVSA